MTANPHPCSKALRIIAVLVAGGAEAKPNGFSNLIPHISTERSTSSISVWKSGSFGGVVSGKPCGQQNYF